MKSKLKSPYIKNRKIGDNIELNIIILKDEDGNLCPALLNLSFDYQPRLLKQLSKYMTDNSDVFVSEYATSTIPHGYVHKIEYGNHFYSKSILELNDDEETSKEYMFKAKFGDVYIPFTEDGRIDMYDYNSAIKNALVREVGKMSYDPTKPCVDLYDTVLKDGDTVDVSGKDKNGKHSHSVTKIYEIDGELFFKPFDKEQNVREYLSVEMKKVLI